MTAAGRGAWHALAIARRELGAYFHSPIAYVVLVLFLVVQGFSFWAVVNVLSDPSRPAPYGAVLRTHFGGTFLYWTFLFFVVAAITMRLVADERRQGTWEALCTAPVGDASIVVGKWLGALAFYAALWAPTLAYVGILRAFAPPGAAPDAGPILTAYLGVLVSGAAFLALGLAASAATSDQIVAAILAFVLLLVLLLVGLSPEVARGWFADHPTARAVAEAVDVRRHLDDFARGIVDTRHLAFYAGLATVSLVAATMLVPAGRRAAGRARPAALGVALVAAAVLLANVIVHRHPRRLDATAARVYTLEERTRLILADVRQPVRVLVLAARDPRFADLYDEIREVLGRFRAAQPLIVVEELDPAIELARIDELAEAYRLTPDEIRDGGLVIVASGERRQGVGMLDLAEFGPGEGGARLTSFRGEEVLAGAILEVADDVRPEVCFTTGHGELPLGGSEAGLDLDALTRALERDAVRASELAEIAGGIPPRCAAVAVWGPRTRFSPEEVRALGDYVDGGGRLLVALEPDLAAGEEAMRPTGLEPLLAARGARPGPALVLDPRQEFGPPGPWRALGGYGSHPISAPFQLRRLTIWIGPRWIEPLEVAGWRVAPLLSSSEDGWGETDLAALRVGLPRAPDAKDVRGPVPIAVAAEAEAEAGGGRLVVVGSARSFATEVLDLGISANDAFATSAVAWLTGRTKLIGVGAKTPEQFRLVLTASQKERLYYLCVVGLPLLVGLGGALALWRRRRS